jgi:hypothetical protein
MPPLPLRGVIENAATALASRAAHLYACFVSQPDVHSPCFHAQLHLCHLPVLIESEKKMIMVLKALIVAHSPS